MQIANDRFGSERREHECERERELERERKKTRVQGGWMEITDKG